MFNQRPICIIFLGQNFTSYPRENKTVSEGEETSFTCVAVRSDGSNFSPLWNLTDVNNKTTIIGANQTLPNGTNATVGINYRSPLILSNINRVWNGATVKCVVNNVEVVNQPEPFPILIVTGPTTQPSTAGPTTQPIPTGLPTEVVIGIGVGVSVIGLVIIIGIIVVVIVVCVKMHKPV